MEQEKKVKIICTIGPATQDINILVKLIEAGMNAARLNFSHGNYDLHRLWINNIRSASGIINKPIAIIQDLQGPKIRIGKVENGSVELIDGQTFIITTNELSIGNSNKVSTSYQNLIQEVQPGNTILLDDGYLVLLAEKIAGNEIVTKVIKGGLLKDNKGIIIPGAKSFAPAISTKDIDDLKFGLNNDVDIVAMSFVRSEKDIIELKAIMKAFNKSKPIIAKIERPEALERIDKIIDEADAIMIARGDLGLELPTEQVPLIQKEIIKKCNYFGKPVITATQMLESMIENPMPTRAEASDVANAVLDGSDCLMLSGETSIGRFPLDAVNYMKKIIVTTEKTFSSRSNDFYNPPKVKSENIIDALAKASCVLAEQMEASGIVALTKSGDTAIHIAKYRPKLPIIALTTSLEVATNMSIVWGVNSFVDETNQNEMNNFDFISEILLKCKIFKKGDYVVLVAGLSDVDFYSYNLLKVYQI